MVHHTIIAWLFIAHFVLLSGCRERPQDEGSKATVTVTDFRGTTISRTAPVARVVSLLESATTGIYMLHAESLLAGISTNIYTPSLFPYYSALDRRIREHTLPAPGNWDFVNLESVVALQPDLVILWASQTESIAALESHGIPVYAVSIRSTEDIVKEITDLGLLLDRQERAAELTAWSNERLHAMSRPAGERPSVYFMWSSGIFETAGRTSAVNDLITAAGCRNVCTEEQEHLSINAETLIAWDPEIILMWSNDTADPADILNNNELRTVYAVKAQNVFELPGAFDCDLWTLKYVHAAEFLSRAAHGPSTPHSVSQLRDSVMTFLYGRSF